MQFPKIDRLLSLSILYKNFVDSERQTMASLREIKSHDVSAHKANF